MKWFSKKTTLKIYCESYKGHNATGAAASHKNFMKKIDQFPEFLNSEFQYC